MSMIAKRVACTVVASIGLAAAVQAQTLEVKRYNPSEWTKGRFTEIVTVNGPGKTIYLAGCRFRGRNLAGRRQRLGSPSGRSLPAVPLRLRQDQAAAGRAWRDTGGRGEAGRLRQRHPLPGPGRPVPKRGLRGRADPRKHVPGDPRLCDPGHAAGDRRDGGRANSYAALAAIAASACAIASGVPTCIQTPSRRRPCSRPAVRRAVEQARQRKRAGRRALEQFGPQDRGAGIDEGRHLALGAPRAAGRPPPSGSRRGPNSRCCLRPARAAAARPCASDRTLRRAGSRFGFTPSIQMRVGVDMQERLARRARAAP